MTLYQGESASVQRTILHSAHEALTAGRRVGVLATSEQAAALRSLPILIADLGSEHDVNQVAGRLYAALRELDAAELDVILAHDLPQAAGLWCALRDRLHRAAARVIQASQP